MRRIEVAASWLLLILCVVGAIGTFVIDLLAGSVGPTSAIVISQIAYPIVGAIITTRRGGKIGWLMTMAGVCIVLLTGSEAYASHALVTDPGSLPGGIFAAWLSTWVYAPMLGILAFFLPLWFPTGKLISRRWIPVLVSAATFVVLAAVTNALLPDNVRVRGLGVVRNPFGWDEGEPLVRTINTFSGVFALIGAGSVAALIVRFRRSRGAERQQLKMFTFAAALSPLPFIFYNFSEPLSEALSVLVMPLIPIAVGLAILRHGLYDIDRVISRTVSYAIVTGLIALPYAVLVPFVGTLIGGSQLAVAAGTLAAAAAVRPLHARVRRLVERRFNRRAFDSARIVDAFSKKVRQEVNLAALSNNLMGVVEATMQPAGAGLWLRRS